MLGQHAVATFEYSQPSPSKSHPEVVDVVLFDLRVDDWQGVGARTGPHQAVSPRTQASLLDPPPERQNPRSETWGLVSLVAGGRHAVEVLVRGRERGRAAGLVAARLRGSGGLELGALLDLHTERVCDVAQPGEAG